MNQLFMPEFTICRASGIAESMVRQNERISEPLPGLKPVGYSITPRRPSAGYVKRSSGESAKRSGFARSVREVSVKANTAHLHTASELASFMVFRRKTGRWTLTL